MTVVPAILFGTVLLLAYFAVGAALVRIFQRILPEENKDEDIAWPLIAMVWPVIIAILIVMVVFKGVWGWATRLTDSAMDQFVGPQKKKETDGDA